MSQTVVVVYTALEGPSRIFVSDKLVAFDKDKFHTHPEKPAAAFLVSFFYSL